MNLDLCRSEPPDESGQSTQSIRFGEANLDWSMGEGTSSLRLWTVLRKCQYALVFCQINHDKALTARLRLRRESKTWIAIAKPLCGGSV